MDIFNFDIRAFGQDLLRRPMLAHFAHLSEIHDPLAADRFSEAFREFALLMRDALVQGIIRSPHADGQSMDSYGPEAFEYLLEHYDINMVVLTIHPLFKDA